MAASAPPRPGTRGYPVKTVRHHREGIAYHVRRDDLPSALGERELWLTALLRDELRRCLASLRCPEPLPVVSPGVPHYWWTTQVTLVGGVAHTWKPESRRGSQSCLCCGVRFKQPAQRVKRSGVCAPCRQLGGVRLVA